MLIWIMGFDTRTLGMLLATLSDPAELNDPDSLTHRITTAEELGRPGQWEYRLIPTRYPVDQSVVLSAKILLPASDLPEVVSRLRDRV